MNLKRLPQDRSERAARATKKPKCYSQDHNFSPINNPGTVLEMSAVLECFGTTFTCVLRKIKNIFCGHLSFLTIMKTTFSYFHKKRMQIVPKYLGPAEVSKTVSGLIFGEKLRS